MAKKAFNLCFQPLDFDLLFSLRYQKRTDCHHCELVCSRNDVKFSYPRNAAQNTFRDFSNGNGTEFQSEFTWPAVCNVIKVGF